MSLEPYTMAETVITSDHGNIHARKKFEVSIRPPSTVAASGSYAFGFTTPAIANGLVHFRVPRPFSSANLGRLRIIEGLSWTAPAGIRMPKNRYRYNKNWNNPNDTTFIRNYNDGFGMPVYTGVTQAALTSGSDMLAATAGGNFGNQPANDGVEIVSDSTADTTQQITLYGVLNGATTTLVTETLTLTGTTQLDSAYTDWATILGVELDSAAAGTITVREASGNATITTIASGTLTAGVHIPTLMNANGAIPVHDASGASTAAVGLIGDDGAGNEITSVDALNGTTDEDHGVVEFANVTKVLIGAVASSVNVTIRQGFAVVFDQSFGVGGTPSGSSGGEGNETEEIVLAPNTKYVVLWENIGVTTATQFAANMGGYLER